MEALRGAVGMVGAIVGVGLLIFALAGCEPMPKTPTPTMVTPRIDKVCDGDHLIYAYINGGIVVVPNGCKR